MDGVVIWNVVSWGHMSIQKFRSNYEYEIFSVPISILFTLLPICCTCHFLCIFLCHFIILFCLLAQSMEFSATRLSIHALHLQWVYTNKVSMMLARYKYVRTYISPTKYRHRKIVILCKKEASKPSMIASIETERIKLKCNFTTRIFQNITFSFISSRNWNK